MRNICVNVFVENESRDLLQYAKYFTELLRFNYPIRHLLVYSEKKVRLRDIRLLVV
jgi:hypothetical protein